MASSRLQLLLLLLLTLLSVAFGKEFSHSTGYGTTRDEVKANRAKRREQLEGMLAEAKETMDDHNNGRRILEERDRTLLERKINAYERKLETMQGELDEREIDRIIQREQLRQERDTARRLERRERGWEL